MARIGKLFLDTRQERPCFINAENRGKGGNEPRVQDNMLAANFGKGNGISRRHKQNSEIIHLGVLLSTPPLLIVSLERSPVRFRPNTDIGHPIKELAKRRRNLRITHEFL